MRQYCRYCAECLIGDVAGVYCTAKDRFMSESTARSPNKCKMFRFVDIDIFDETDGYKPRRKKQIDGQMTLF